MTIIVASQHLRQLFDQNWLNKTAKQQGFGKRLRDIRPLELVSSLVSAPGDGKVDAIADWHRRVNGYSSGDSSRRGLYAILQPAATSRVCRFYAGGDLLGHGIVQASA
jgi:hypothetical protein